MTYAKRFLALALALVALTFLVDSTSAAAFKRVFKGDKAPTFSLPDLDGNMVNLEDYGEGPLTIVVFWSTWSGNSQPLLADIQKIIDEFSTDTVKVTALAVNAEGENSPADLETSVREFVAANGLTFPVILDKDMEEYNKWGVIATPSTAFLGKDLEVLYEFSGHPTSAYEDMRAEVMKILGLEEEMAAAAKPRRDRYEADKKVSLNFGLARTLYERGQFSKAERKLRGVLTDDPQFPDARSLNGLIHLAMADADDDKDATAARQAFQESLELDATDPKGLVGAAHFALVDGDTAKAIELTRKSVEFTELAEMPSLAGEEKAAEGEKSAAKEEDTAGKSEEGSAGEADAAAASAGEAAEAALVARLDEAATALEAGNGEEAGKAVREVVDALLAIPEDPTKSSRQQKMMQMMKKKQ